MHAGPYLPFEVNNGSIAGSESAEQPLSYDSNGNVSLCSLLCHLPDMPCSNVLLLVMTAPHQGIAAWRLGLL